MFNLSDTLAKEGGEELKVPREYKMVLSKVEQSMGSFSEGPPGKIAFCRLQSILWIIDEKNKTEIIINDEFHWKCWVEYCY